MGALSKKRDKLSKKRDKLEYKIKVPCLTKQSDERGLNPRPPGLEFEVLTTQPCTHASTEVYTWFKNNIFKIHECLVTVTKINWAQQFSQNGKKNNSGSKNSIQKEYTVHENEATFKEVQLTLSYWTPL